MSQALVDQLREVCGIRQERAVNLLRESGNDLETAIALHFANPTGPLNAPQSPRTELCSLLGNSIDRQQAQRLLQRAGSVGAAADMYFDQPGAAGPASERGGRGGSAGGQGAISISESGDDVDDEEEEQGDGEMDDQEEGEEAAAPGRAATRRRGARAGSRNRAPQQDQAPQAAAAPVPVRCNRTMATARTRAAPAAAPAAAAGDEGPAAAGAAAAAAATASNALRGGGRAGSAMQQFLSNLIGLPLLLDSDDSDDYGSDHDSDSSGGGSRQPANFVQPGVQRTPPIALPDLNVAAAQWAQAHALQQLPSQPGGPAPGAAEGVGPSTAAGPAAAVRPPPPRVEVRPVNPKLLPLPKLRRAGGGLFTEKQEAVPPVVRSALTFPLHLGSVELPLTKLDIARLEKLQGEKQKHWRELEWGWGCALPCDFGTSRVGWFSRYEVSGLNLRGVGEKGGDGVPAVACVRDNRAASWLSKLLIGLFALREQRLVDIKCRLVAPQQDQQKAEQQRQQSQSQNESGKADAADAGQLAAEASAAGSRQRRGRSASLGPEAASGAGKRGGGKAAGKAGSGAAASEGAGAAAGFCGSSNRAVAAEAKELPTAILVEVWMTQQARDRSQWYDERSGDVPERMQGRKPRWQKYDHQYLGEFSDVLSALLRFGSGLSLGPDCDGALNLQAQPSEWVDVAQAQNRRRLFDVRALLDSVAFKRPGPSRTRAPEGMATKPKQYQLAGLEWMMGREAKGDALGRGQLFLHPAWLQLHTQDGQLLYVNRLSPHYISSNFYSAPIGGTCGGFLVDEMGLGKTLQTLMLVLANRPPEGWAVSSLEGLAITADSEPIPIKCSLIVVPSNLIGQWAEEIEQHLKPGQLKWGRYLAPGSREAAVLSAQPTAKVATAADAAADSGGTRRSLRVAMAAGSVNLANGSAPARPILCRAPDGSALPMHEADVVLMSYEQLRDQMFATTSTQNASLLNQFGFWRVVLDEAQLVANSSSVAAVVASSLWRRHAWVVTGTPISSKLDEIRGLLEFLAYEPFHHATVWRDLLQHYYEKQSAGGLLALRSLLRGVMLRRSKADVAHELELPPHTREDKWVTLSPVEQLCYQQSKRAFCEAAFQLSLQQSVEGQNQHRSTAASRLPSKTLSALGALRQSCCHPQIVRHAQELLGKERKSMRDIMASLVNKAYAEWDQAARRLLDARLLAGAAEAGVGARPGPSLKAVLDLVRANVAAAGDPDIRHAAGNTRKMFAEVAAHGEASGQAAAAGTAGDMPRNSAASGAAAAGEQANGKLAATAGGSRELAKGPAPDAKRKAPMTEQQQQQQQQQQQLQLSGASQSLRRQRSREEQQEEQQQRQQQQGSAGGIEEGDSQMAAALQADEDAAGSGQQADAVLQSEEEKQAEKEAVSRARQWRKLELDGLELWCHLLRQCISGPASQTAAAAGKASAAAHPPSKRMRLGSGRGGLAAAAAGGHCVPEAAADGADEEGLQAQLDASLAELEALKHELNVKDDGLGDGRLMRRSRRRAGIDADDEMTEVPFDLEEAQEQLLNAKVILRSYNELMARRDPKHSAKVAVAAAEKECRETWHHLQHMANKEAALLAAEKGKAAAAAEGPAGQAPAGTAAALAEQSDLSSCPICFDSLTTRTITACGHHFCGSCIREVLAHGTRICPICRTPISEADLFDTASEEEARLSALAKEAKAGGSSGNMEYGAKVSTLLEELAAMKAADPSAKAVVFSSWGRLLKLVGDALANSGFTFATLAGTNGAEREKALHRFIHDPDCTVLTVVMSTAGGAAGLTLTVATTAFLMEPSLNPGLEAQAAARIWRLGQTKPTRVVRLLAADSVEAAVLEVQRRKQEAGEVPADSLVGEVDPGMVLQVYEAIKEGDNPTV